MTSPVLEAGAVRLRPLELADAAALFPGFADPELMTYWSGPAHVSLDETQNDLAWWIYHNGDAAWAIEHDGAVVGRIGLYVVRAHVRDVGVFLMRAAQGKGVASAALELIVRDGFDRLGLQRIGADIDPDNAPSVRLFERAGFAYEGRLRANWRTHLGVRDSLIYARLSARASDTGVRA